MGHSDQLYMPENHMDSLYNGGSILDRFVQCGRLNCVCNSCPSSDQPLAFLDGGCGEGHLIAELHKRHPRYEYTGVDVTEVALKSAKARCSFADFHLMDITSLPFPDSAFDVVVSSQVIEHISEYEKAIAELKRVLKPGGILILSFPNERMLTLARLILGKRPIKVPDHVQSLTPATVVAEVDLPVISKRSLPFRLPFLFSYASLITFRKV